MGAVEKYCPLYQFMENIVDLYYEKLLTEKNPGNLLARFFGEIHGVATGRRHIIMFNRLIKIYGRFLVFFSVLDVASMKDVNLDSDLNGLFYHFCNKRFQRSHPDSILPQYAVIKTSLLEAQVEKMKSVELTIPDSKELE